MKHHILSLSSTKMGLGLIAFLLLFASEVFSQSFTEQTGANNPMDGVDIGEIAVPAIADLDDDGDWDLLVGEINGQFLYYENTGTSAAPILTQQTGANNPMDGVDVGDESKPFFWDIDNDGDYDLFVAEDAGGVFYYENTGTAASPTFTARTGASNPFDGVTVGAEADITFGDIDNDGDADAFIGEDDGNINFFENTGTISAPVFTEQTGANNPLDGEDVGVESSPSLMDFDDDGDYDMFVGAGGGGGIDYFENTGTKTAPVFVEITGVDHPFNGFSFTEEPRPMAIDLNGDGDTDMLVSFRDGTFRYFTGSGTGSSPLDNHDNKYATLPYLTGFETGDTDEYWITRSSDALGRVQVTTANTPNTGTYHMTMDVNAAGTFNTNEAWLFLDLSGETQVDLEFFWKEFGDEEHADDGIYFSDDGGTTFTKVFDLFGNAGGWEQENLDVDALATANSLSLTSTFVVKFQQYDNYAIANDGFAFDDILVSTPNMAFISSTTTQNASNTVLKSTTDQEIIGLEVVTLGSVNAIDITSFDFNTNGATNASNDISNAKLYYTGTTATFATTTQVGTTVASPNGSFTITGTQTLSEGTNYFWLTYDINAGAITNNIVDAEVTQFTVDGTNQIPSISAPSGSRTIIETPEYASFPYYTSFETGFFENEWLVSSSNSNGRIQVTEGNNPRNGNYHMTMDVTTAGTVAQNTSDLYIDLSGQTEVELEFYVVHFSEGNAGTEGVYLSDDGGANYTFVHHIDPGAYYANDYNRVVLDIDALATANALSLTNTFVIRFLQTDNGPIGDLTDSDGFGFDDIIVRVPPCTSPTYVTLPYYEGFEAGYLDAEWCTTNPGGVNNTSVSKEYTPHVGDFHLIMESIEDGTYATNEALLHLDLSGETQVEMSFYYKEFGDEDDNVDGIYFSDDGGANFVFVHEIDPTATVNETWTNLVLDVDNLATTNGLSLTSNFVIKFLQYDNSFINFDGFAYDEIQVYSNATNWTGNTNSNWNTNGNWSNGVPDCSTLVTIPDVSGASGNFPVVNAGGSPSVGDIIIQSGASITINSGRTLFVCGNWNNYGSAALGLGTVEFQGTEIQEITGANTFQNLTINNVGSFVRLVDDQTINGALTLTDGIVDTNFNTLTMSSGSSTSGASAISFVDGPMTKIGNTDFEFPIGEGSTWAPLGISNLSGDAATVFTAEYFSTEYFDTENFRPTDPNGDLNNVSLNEYWDLNNSGTASSTDITLYWKNQGQSGIENYSDLNISHYTGTYWENLGQAAISGNDPGWVRVEGVSSFSPFSFGSADGSNPLPVELVAFTAEENDGKVILDWQTASELNNDYFEIHRSEDGENWENIGQVDGNGTINELISYAFTDHAPLYGNSYYRLKQVDFDGQFEFSPIRSVTLASNQNQINVSIYPNPTSENNINIRLISTNDRNDVKIRMVDLAGKVVVDKTMAHEKFVTDQKIIADQNLKSGIYILEVKQGENVSKHKVILL